MGLTKLYAADTLAVMVLNKGAIKCPVLLHFSIYLRFWRAPYLQSQT